MTSIGGDGRYLASIHIGYIQSAYKVSDVITIPTGYLPHTDRQLTQCNNRTGCIVYSEPVSSTQRLIVHGLVYPDIALPTTLLQ